MISETSLVPLFSAMNQGVERGFSSLFNLDCDVQTTIRRGVQRYFVGQQTQPILQDAREALRNIAQVGKQLNQLDRCRSECKAEGARSLLDLTETIGKIRELEVSAQAQVSEYDAAIRQLREELQSAQRRIDQNSTIPLMRNPLQCEKVRTAVRIAKHAAVAAMPVITCIHRNAFVANCTNALQSISAPLQCASTCASSSFLIPLAVAVGVGLVGKALSNAADQFEQDQAKARRLEQRVTKLEEEHRRCMAQLSGSIESLRTHSTDTLAKLQDINKKQQRLDDRKSQLDRKIVAIQTEQHEKIIRAQARLIEDANSLSGDAGTRVGFIATETILRTMIAERASVASTLAVTGSAEQVSTGGSRGGIESDA